MKTDYWQNPYYCTICRRPCPRAYRKDREALCDTCYEKHG